MARDGRFPKGWRPSAPQKAGRWGASSMGRRVTGAIQSQGAQRLEGRSNRVPRGQPRPCERIQGISPCTLTMINREKAARRLEGQRGRPGRTDRPLCVLMGGFVQFSAERAIRA